MAKPAIGARINAAGRWREVRALTVYVLRRFKADRCLRVAASLSYTTLLALVPLMTIAFAMFSAFPAFEDVEEKVITFAFENAVPELGAAVSEQFRNFADNAGQLSAIGIVVLAFTALMMFATVEAAFGVIWRIEQPRPLASRLLIFWAMLTLGPMLIGASVTLSTYIFTLTRMLEIEAFTGPLGRFVRLLPALFEVAAFSLLYLALPNRRIDWRHAVAGGVVAAVLFELMKKGFALYIANFPSQQTIYGALSTIPLFLVWMYISWAAVLIGAEITASIPEYRRARGGGDSRQRRLMVALGILGALVDAARREIGGGLTARDLRRALKGDEMLVEPALDRLAKARYVAETAKQDWLLTRDLDSVSLYDLVRDLGLVAGREATDGGGPGWRRRLADVVAASDAAQQEIMAGSIEALLDGGDAAPPKRRGRTGKRKSA